MNSAGVDTVIATIGQKYASSLLAGGGFSKTSLVLTDRTLSGVGKTYAVRSNGVISFSGNLKNVSSMGIEYSSSPILILIGILTLPFFGLGLLFLILYFVLKQSYIVTNFHGAMYALSMKGIASKDAQVFIEQVLKTAESR